MRPGVAFVSKLIQGDRLASFENVDHELFLVAREVLEFPFAAGQLVLPVREGGHHEIATDGQIDDGRGDVHGIRGGVGKGADLSRKGALGWLEGDGDVHLAAAFAHLGGGPDGRGQSWGEAEKHLVAGFPVSYRPQPRQGPRPE